MQVVVAAGSKGGVGKATIASNLAVLAHAEKKRVGLLDLDPMQSLARWHELREADQGADETFFLLESNEDVRGRVAKARDKGFDVFVIDLPPAETELMEWACRAALRDGMVVILRQPSPFDLEGQRAMKEIVQNVGCEVLFVINRVRGKTLLKGTRQILESVGKVADTEVADRVVYAVAAIKGGAGAEKSDEAHDEMEALWKEVKASLRRTEALTGVERRPGKGGRHE